MSVDLHSHSNVSDGSFSPSELARLFRANGVRVAALTDHDTTGGGEEFLKSCSEAGITGIVGIEISTTMSDGTEAHVLGFGLRSDNPVWCAFLKSHHEYLRHRCEETLSLLAKYGYSVPIEDVYRISRGNPPMPPHILMAMGLNGIITSIDEAVQFFWDYLATDAKAWVPHETHPETAIRAINESGGVSLISHPYRYPGVDRLEELLDLGARGFELYYPGQNGEVFERLSEIARRRNCIVTGGCDFHGAFAERRIREVEVPDWVAERLFEAIGLTIPTESHAEGDLT